MGSHWGFFVCESATFPLAFSKVQFLCYLFKTRFAWSESVTNLLGSRKANILYRQAGEQ